MDNHPHKKQFGAEDFQRYHQGTMPAAERHALEKAALEDDFLTDALEGYLFTENVKGDVTEIRNRLATRIKKDRKVTPLYKHKNWLRIAALFLVLLGAGWSVYKLSLSKKESIAVNKEGEKSIAPQRESQLLPAAADTINAEQKNVTADGFKNAPSTTTVLPQKVATNKRNTPPFQPEISPEKRDVATAPSSKEEVLKMDTTSNASLQKSIANASAPVTFFNGKVVDTKGNPLPYVSITTQQDKIATTTDLNGNFSIKAADTALNATVSAAGFEANRLFLNAPAQNKVVLKESVAALNEVVVTGMGQSRKKEVRKPIVPAAGFVPNEGWQQFEDYITQNLKTPDEVKEKTLSGEVVLSFDMNMLGEPVNIKVVKSLCAACDTEAIRLLQNGPKWKKGSGKKGVVSIRF